MSKLIVKRDAISLLNIRFIFLILNLQNFNSIEK